MKHNAASGFFPSRPPSSFPLPEYQTTVHIAEAEAGLSDDFEIRAYDDRMRNALGKGDDLGMEILAVERGVDEPPIELQDGGHAFDRSRRPQAVTNHRFGRIDPGEILRPPAQGCRPVSHFHRVSVG